MHVPDPDQLIAELQQTIHRSRPYNLTVSLNPASDVPVLHRLDRLARRSVSHVPLAGPLVDALRYLMTDFHPSNTGCRSGFGLLTAVSAARDGHTVYAGLRDLSTAGALREAADGLAVHPVQLDVTVSAQREAVVSQIIEAHGRIDSLVNNAWRGAGRSGRAGDRAGAAPGV